MLLGADGPVVPGSGNPPGGSCRFCIVKCSDPETGDFHFHFSSITNQCQGESVMDPVGAVWCTYTGCTDEDGDGTCAGDETNTNPNETLNNEFGNDPIFGDDDEDGIPNVFDPNNPRAIMPPGLDPQDWDEWFERVGVPELGDVDFSHFGTPADYDKNGDGTVSVSEVLKRAADFLHDIATLGPNMPFGLGHWIDDILQLADILESLANAMGPSAFGGQGRFDQFMNALDQLQVDVAAIESAFAGGTVTISAQGYTDSNGQHVTHIDVFVNGEQMSDWASSIFLGTGPDAIAGLDVKVEWNGQALPANFDLAAQSDSTTGDPVDTSRGAFNYGIADLQVGAFPISRHYDSRSTRLGIFGRGWTSSLEANLMLVNHVDGSTAMVFSPGDGTYQYFVPDSSTGGYRGYLSSYGKIIPYKKQFNREGACTTQSQGYILRQPDGTLRYFCPPSRIVGFPLATCFLNKIVSPDGSSALAIDRDRVGRPTRLMDEVGREYRFEFNRKHGLLTSILGPEGIRIDYSYDVNSNLASSGNQGLTGGGSASTGAGSGSQQHPGATPIDPSVRTLRPVYKKELTRVDYPTSLTLNDQGVLTPSRGYEIYTYFEHPEGFAAHPDDLLNHNLKAIYNPAGLVVDLEYYTDIGSYDFDRVKQHRNASGLSVLYSYSRTTSPVPDSFGQSIAHVTRALFEEAGTSGASEVPPRFTQQFFRHGVKGHLLRHEVSNGKFSASGALLAGSGPQPGEPNLWAKVYSYDNEYLLTQQCRTTDLAPLGGQCIEYLYDNSNSDRFRQADVLQVKTKRDPANPVGPLELSSSFVRDPVTGQVVLSTDTLGRIHRTTLAHQELTQAQVGQLRHVRDWNIGLAPPFPNFWGKGDVNGDGKLGGNFGPIKIEQPSVTIEAANGPGGAQTVTPEQWIRYGANGLKTAEKDAAGIWTEYRYNAQRLVAKKIVNPVGPALIETYSYNSLGQMTGLVGADGSTKQMLLDWRGRLLELRSSVAAGNPQQIVHQTFYNGAGFPVGTRTPFYSSLGIVTYTAGLAPPLSILRTFDPVENVVALRRQIVDEQGTHTGIWTARYDIQSRLVEVVTPSPSAVYSLEYDPRGRAIAFRRTAQGGADLGTTRYEFDHYGELIKAIGPLDSSAPANGTLDTASYVYDGLGRLIESRSPIGLKTILSLDAAGRVLTREIKDASGPVGFEYTVAKTDLAYDSWDRVVSERSYNYKWHGIPVAPSEGPASILNLHGFGVRDHLWSIVNPGPEQILTRLTYDALGRLRSRLTGSPGSLGEFGFVNEQIDAAGRVTERRDIHNRLGQTGSVNPSETVWRYDFDQAGRLSRSTDPKGSVTEYPAYTASGLVITVIDPIGKTTHKSYDSAERLLRITELGADGSSRATRSRFDIKDNLLELIDGKNQSTLYGYDELGRQTLRRFADGSENVAIYDQADRVIEVRKPGPVTIQLWYDEANRMTDLSGTGVGVTPVSLGYSYDAAGLFEYAYDGIYNRSVETRRTSLGQVLSEESVGGGVATFTMSFDGRGLPRQLIYPSGNSATQSYDEAGRISSMQHHILASGVATQIANFATPYGASHLIANLANGATLANSVDPLGRTISKIATASNGAVLAGEHLDFDGVGNVKCRTSALDGRKEVFQYDGFDRLKDWWFGVANCNQTSGAQRHVSWQFDAADNLEQKTDTLGNLNIVPTTNFLNQITSFPTVADSKQYTPRGEEQSRTWGSGNSMTWVWDALGRPRQTTVVEGGTKQILWSYDPLGRLVSRTVDGVQANRFQYFGDQRLVSMDASGTKEYVPGPHGIWRLRNNSEKTFLHFDATGNVRAVHDGVTTLEAYDYDPYGLPRRRSDGSELTSSNLGNELLFLGKPYLFDLKLNLLEARLHDPRSEGFISRDPLGEAGGQNLYGYGNKNPLRFADPSGLRPASLFNNAPEPGDGRYPHIHPGAGSTCYCTDHGDLPDISKPSEPLPLLKFGGGTEPTSPSSGSWGLALEGAIRAQLIMLSSVIDALLHPPASVPENPPATPEPPAAPTPSAPSAPTIVLPPQPIVVLPPTPEMPRITLDLFPGGHQIAVSNALSEINRISRFPGFSGTYHLYQGPLGEFEALRAARNGGGFTIYDLTGSNGLFRRPTTYEGWVKLSLPLSFRQAASGGDFQVHLSGPARMLNHGPKGATSTLEIIRQGKPPLTGLGMERVGMSFGRAIPYLGLFSEILHAFTEDKINKEVRRNSGFSPIYEGQPIVNFQGRWMTLDHYLKHKDDA